MSDPVRLRVDPNTVDHAPDPTIPMRQSAWSDFEDPDEVALRQAREELDREEGRTPNGDQRDLDDLRRDPQDNPPAAPAARQPANANGPAPSVPLPRFQEVIRTVHTLKSELDAARGALAEARRTAGNGAQPANPQPARQPAADPFQGRADAAYARLEALEAQRDGAEIDAKQYVAAKRKIDADLAAIERDRQQAATNQMLNARTDQDWKDRLTAQETRLNALPDMALISDADAHALASIAYRRLAERGEPITSSHPSETIRLREECAAALPGYLMGLHGQEGLARLRQERGILGNGRAAPPPANGRVADRLRDFEGDQDRGRNHPPDTRNLNAGGSGRGADLTFTEAQIEAMSTDELAALPASVRRNYMGME